MRRAKGGLRWLVLSLALTALSASHLPTAEAQVGTIECSGGSAGPYPCANVDLLSFLPLPLLGVGNGNDIWGWTDPETGKEYAIVGTSTTTGFVDVSDPEFPTLIGHLPTEGQIPQLLWRDIKVDQDHAFIVSEWVGSGLQIFDLTRLRGAVVPTVFTADATYDGFSRAHNIAINTDTHVAYVLGSDKCHNGEEGGGLLMLDISSPLAPADVGCALLPTTPPSPNNPNYVHDAQCVIYSGPDPTYGGRDICVGSNEEAVVIYDVTNKSSPVIVSVTPYATAAYTHQGWLTPNHRFFVFGDEGDELDGTVASTTTYILDLNDLDSPTGPMLFAHETTSIDHNIYIDGSLAYQSNYSAGLRILSFDDSSLASGDLTEVGFFDVTPAHDEPEFVGTWSNYPFFESGIVIVSAMDNAESGLFVLGPRVEAQEQGSQDDSGAGGTGLSDSGLAEQLRPLGLSLVLLGLAGLYWTKRRKTA